MPRRKVSALGLCWSPCTFSCSLPGPSIGCARFGPASAFAPTRHALRHAGVYPIPKPNSTPIIALRRLEGAGPAHGPPARTGRNQAAQSGKNCTRVREGSEHHRCDQQQQPASPIGPAYQRAENGNIPISRRFLRATYKGWLRLCPQGAPPRRRRGTIDKSPILPHEQKYRREKN